VPAQDWETALVPLRAEVPGSVLELASVREREWALESVPASVPELAWAVAPAWVLDLVTALAPADLAKVPAQGLATASVVQGSAPVQVLRRAAAPRPG
jgi:hypothetical protein